MRPSPSIRPVALAALALATLVVGSCAHSPARLAPGEPPAAAFVPLEDLSGRPGAGDRVSEVVYTALAASGHMRLVERGDVGLALDAARIRSSGALTREQTREIARQVQVRWIITGSVMEYGKVRTPDGEVPSVGIALRLIDGTSGTVVWADQRHRSGDDHETIFGWGRVDNLDDLARRTAVELAGALRFPGLADTSSTWKGVP